MKKFNVRFRELVEIWERNHPEATTYGRDNKNGKKSDKMVQDYKTSMTEEEYNRLKSGSTDQ